MEDQDFHIRDIFFIFDLKDFKCLWMSQQIAFLQCQKVNSKSFYKSEKKYSQGWENGSQE